MSFFSRLRPRDFIAAGTGLVAFSYAGSIVQTAYTLGRDPIQTTSDNKTGLGLADKYFRYGSIFRSLPISPETSHHAIISLLSHPHSTRVALGLTDMHPDPPSLHTSICGLYLSNPIGLAAGMDKDGDAIDGILDMGFGFMEIGSVTPLPQPGNPFPRLFRLSSDRCIINRYGFNSDGIDAVRHRLLLRHAIHARSYVHIGKTTEAQHAIDQNKGKIQYVHVEPIAEEMEQIVKGLQSTSFSATFRTATPFPTPKFSYPIISVFRGGLVGLNLGKNKLTEDAASDYVHSIKHAGYLADYIVVNVSSPNTPGLRDLQGKKSLHELLSRVKIARDQLHISHPSSTSTSTPTSTTSFPPLFVKIAPDLTDDDKRDIADVVMDVGMDGMIISNTTITRPASLTSSSKGEVGGLSGPILMEPSTALVAEMYRLTNGRIPIIGVGGVSSGADAYRKIRAGASAVQLYTAFIYDGPALVGHIKRDLAALLARDGYSNVSEAVGVDARIQDDKKS